MEISEAASTFPEKTPRSKAKGNVKLSIISAFVCAILAITALSEAVFTIFWAISPDGWNPEPKSFLQQLQSLWQIDFAVLVAKLTFPAWLVHLWLPLFLVGAGINSGINAFLGTVRFAQWFIKRGNAHPFEAIGMTASAVTFVGAVLLQGIIYLSWR